MLDLRRQLEKQMLVSRVQQTEVMGKIGVTDEEVEGLLRRTQAATFATTPQVTLREILVAVPDAPSDGVNVGRRRSRRAPRPPRSTSACSPASRSRGWPPTCPTRRRRPTAACSARFPGPTSRPSCRRRLDALKPGDVTARAAHVARLPDPEARRPRRRRHAEPLDDAREAVSEQVFEQQAPRRVRRSTSCRCAPRRSSSGRTTK